MKPLIILDIAVLSNIMRLVISPKPVNGKFWIYYLLWNPSSKVCSFSVATILRCFSFFLFSTTWYVFYCFTSLWSDPARWKVLRIFTAVRYFQAERTIGAKLLLKFSPSVFSCHRIRSWEKNAMGQHRHRCQRPRACKNISHWLGM